MPPDPIRHTVRRQQALELAVFLFLIVPSLVFSFFFVRQGAASFTVSAIAAILRDLALVSLVIYFIWDNHEPVSHLGLEVGRPLREILLGLILFVPMSYTASLVEDISLRAGLHSPKTQLPSVVPGTGAAQLALAVILVIVVAYCEETIFRGYLMLRLRQTTSSVTAAVVFSTIIFSLGHGYEGSAGVVTVGYMGLIFSLVYLWRGNLLAPMVMHFLQDFMGIVLRPS